MATTPSTARIVISATLDLAAEGRWRTLSLAEIARRAGLPLSEVVRLFPDRNAILAAYARDIDAAMLDGAADDDDLSPYDRLLDALMRRFEAMAPDRPALAALARTPGFDPPGLCAGLRHLRRAMATALEIAGLASTGARGLVRTGGLTIIYLNAFRVFLADDSDGLDRTMAALDAGLRRADGLARRLRDTPAAPPPPSPPPAPPPPQAGIGS